MIKLFFIKVGKALNVIKNDGFFQGSKKIASYAAIFLGTIFSKKSGDILFIASGVGDSARYRVFNVAEELEVNGFEVAVAMQDDPYLEKYANKFKIFIFHKTLFNKKIASFIEMIKQQKKEIIFDTDDLNFDPSYLEKSDYLDKINSLEKQAYENGIGSEILNDEYVKVCTATTSYLAEKLEEKNKRVFIVPNKLSNKDLEIAENIIKHKTYNIKQKINGSMFHDTCSMIKVGYFSGTMSHNKDFATITDALMEIMEKYPQVELLLVGPLDVENKLNKFKDRIKQLPYVPREKHFENIAQVDINLAPLEMENPFCEAKSELKFFEAGIVGVPTVAASNQTFREAIFDGIDGFLAANTDEWVEKLEKLIVDEELRKGMGKRAREKSLNNYTNKNSHNSGYYEYLQKRILEIDQIKE